jgi:hypothetical protein
MPLLPQTRETFRDGSLTEVEDLLDRLVTEVGLIVDTGVEYMSRLQDHKDRLLRIRTGFAAARESPEDQELPCT